MKRAFRLPLAIVALLAASPVTAQEVPVVTDSRIKTLVYNENDVYPLLTHYGYQANIEFGPKERIETLSIGDRVGWQIIPSGRRLFIRPLDENAHTNMTVITNLHSYQFDLNSASGELKPSEALVYVVRFYYPEDDLAHMPPSYAGEMAPAAPLTPTAALNSGLGASATGSPAAASPATPGYNYRYTYTGPEKLAPVKIYDDGQSTYLQLASAPNSISMVAPDGKEVPVAATATPEGFQRLSIVGRRFILHYGHDTICIFNEAY